jgi:DNA excision repair protein ERCC-4
MRPRKELRPQDIEAICDSREQIPLDLSPLRVSRGTLPTGDYSVTGLEHEIALERKSLPDLVMCVGVERERFEREVQRLLAYPVRAVIVEATMAQIEAGGWRSKVPPQAVMGSCLSWISLGLPIIFAGDHTAAGRYCAKMLFLAARRRFRELQSFGSSLRIVDPGRDLKAKEAV